MKDLKELHLLGKLVKLDECPILLDSQPDANWQKDWQVMAGEWKVEDGYLIGAERGNKGGILFSRQSFDCDVIFTFDNRSLAFSFTVGNSFSPDEPSKKAEDQKAYTECYKKVS